MLETSIPTIIHGAIGIGIDEEILYSYSLVGREMHVMCYYVRYKEFSRGSIQKNLHSNERLAKKMEVEYLRAYERCLFVKKSFDSGRERKKVDYILLSAFILRIV